MSVKHKKHSAADDGPDTSLVLPSDWNDDHVVTRSVVSVSASGDLDPTAEFVLVTGGDAGITITLPDAATVDQKEITFKRVDAGVGEAVLSAAVGQTIDGDDTYVLLSQWQLVTLQSALGNWYVAGNN